MRALLLCVALLCGCRTEPLPPRLDGGGDLTTVAAVRCGFDTCHAPTVCCSPDVGISGSCILPANCPGGLGFACDDAADCDSGWVCCYTASNGARCRIAAECLDAGGRRLCGSAGECHASEGCCRQVFNAFPTSYRACGDASCL